MLDYRFFAVRSSVVSSHLVECGIMPMLWPTHHSCRLALTISHTFDVLMVLAAKKPTKVSSVAFMPSSLQPFQAPTSKRETIL